MVKSRLLNKCKLCMLYAGNWRISFFKDKLTQFLYYCYADVIRYYHVICLCLVVVDVVILFLSGNMSEATYNLTLCLTGLLIATKTILLRKPKVMKLIEFIFQKEKVIEESKNEGIRSIYEEHVGYVEKISTAIICFVIWFLFCGILSPVSYSVFSNEKVMIFLMYTPFNQEEHYGVSAIIQGVAITIASILYAASQTFYISVTVFVIMELKILQHKCRNFDEYRHEVVPPIGDTELTKELIRDHQSIITFVQDFDAAINIITLLEFLVSSINIAAALFQILDGQNLREIVFAATNCLLLVGQIFILAWHANEISEESVKVSTAMYEILWYNKSISKMLLIMQMRAQRPLRLSLGPFGVLTNATALKVMNTAYSYMTLMIQY